MKSIPRTRHLRLGTVTLMGAEKFEIFFAVGQVGQDFTLAF